MTGKLILDNYIFHNSKIEFNGYIIVRGSTASFNLDFFGLSHVIIFFFWDN